MVGKLIASLGRRHWVQGLAALLIFGSGLVVGSAGTFVALKERLQVGPGLKPFRGDHERFVEFLISDWQPKYELTDEQITKIKPLLLEQFKKLRDIFQESEKRAQELEKPWLASMKKVMTSEQYTQWYQDYQEMKMRRNRRGRGPGRRDRRDGEHDGRNDRRRDHEAPPDRPGPGGPPPDGPFPGGPPPQMEQRVADINLAVQEPNVD